MTRSQAIRKHCLDCAGTTKEVTLCHILDCPLWEYRFGASMDSKSFWSRMKKARGRYPKDFAEMMKQLDIYQQNGVSITEKHSYVVLRKKLEAGLGVGKGKG